MYTTHYFGTSGLALGLGGGGGGGAGLLCWFWFLVASGCVRSVRPRVGARPFVGLPQCAIVRLEALRLPRPISIPDRSVAIRSEEECVEPSVAGGL